MCIYLRMMFSFSFFFHLCDAMSIFILRYTTIIPQTLRRTARDRPFLLCEGKRRNFYPCRKLNSMNACKSENKPFSDGLWCERDMCSTIHIHRRTLTNVTMLLVPNGKKVKQSKPNAIETRMYSTSNTAGHINSLNLLNSVRVSGLSAHSFSIGRATKIQVPLRFYANCISICNQKGRRI